MDKFIRTASLELQLARNNEVVKVAGILNKLKNYLKQLGDREYASAVDVLRSDSWILQQVATQLRKKIKELTEAIDDGDIPSYDAALEEVRSLTADLATELRTLNEDAKANDPRIQSQPSAPDVVPSEPEQTIAPSSDTEAQTYTREQWDDPSKRASIFEQAARMIKIWHPDHDVPIGKNINKPLHDFKWFSDKEVHIKQGNESGAKDRLIDQTARLLVRETSLTYDDAVSYLADPATFDELAKRLVNAIYNGTLLNYIPATPMKAPKEQSKDWIKERQIGEMTAGVKTAEFNIPVFEIPASMTVGLTDMGTPLNGTNKLVLGFTEYSRVSAGGVPPALRKGFQRKPEVAPEPVAPEPQPEPEQISEPIVEPEALAPAEPTPEVAKKKITRRKAKSAFRLELLKGLVKSAGIDPSAAKRLPSTFWNKFVEMSSRLGAKPEDLAQVINSESGFDPHATNVQGGRIIAKGLNQLIEKTAKSLGMSDSEWRNYENVPAEDQLKYVEKFFRSVGKITGVGPKWDSATQLYVANFAPKYVRQASNPNTVLYSKSENREEYEKNKGLDRDKKGHITAGDLARSVTNKKLPDFIAQAIAQAKTGMSPVNLNNRPENDNVDGLLTALFALDAGPVEKLVRHALERKYLPMSQVLITVSSLSAPYDVRFKFAQTASNLINEMIDADTSIHSDGKKIELQCSAAGSQYAVASAIKGLCDCVVKATGLKFNGVEVRCAVLPSTISKYAEVR